MNRYGTFGKVIQINNEKNQYVIEIADAKQLTLQTDHSRFAPIDHDNQILHIFLFTKELFSSIHLGEVIYVEFLGNPYLLDTSQKPQETMATEIYGTDSLLIHTIYSNFIQFYSP